MSALSICQSVYLRVLSSKPPVAATSVDPKVLQALEYVNEAGQELASRHTWQVLTNEATFTTVATPVQGTIAALTGPGFNFVRNDTLWNRTQRRPLFGPKSVQQWQMLQAQFSSGPWISFRIRGNQMLFFPTPAAGQSIYFEWCTKYWCTSALGAPQANFIADTDVALLDERLITLSALWRFKKANKLSYDEEFETAEDAISDAIGRDGTKGRLSLGGTPNEFVPGVIVTAGNWTL